MHFHYFALKHLSRYLNESHTGDKVYECFSQNKNELVLEMSGVSLRIGCQTPLTYVVPVPSFAKARKNVVDLFEILRGRKMLGSRVVDWERELILEFEDYYDLVLKMHGQGANVLLRQRGEVIGLFNHQKEEDLEYEETPGTFDTTAIPEFCDHQEATVLHHLRNISAVFEKQFARKVLEKLKEGDSFPEAFEKVLKLAEKDEFAIRKQRTNVKFILFPTGTDDEVVIEGIAPALQLFLRTQFQYTAYRRQYAEIEKALKKPAEKYYKVYTSYQRNISQLEKDRNPEELGHIIMANLHAITPHQKLVELQDFYGEGTVKIKLDPTLSPQDNAQKYYQKHKQRKGKLTYLKSQLEDIQEKYEMAKEQLEAFGLVPAPEELTFTTEGLDYDEMKALKKFTKEKTQENQKEGKRYPFRTFRKEGFEIFVGKGGKNNDELSFKFASREDLWLHAKDVAGSHVIIRQQAGKPIPPMVLEYAASLAAFYSKRKNDSLVPVQYTTRKYIRKRKGDPPGLVAVDREEVIMVEPVKG